jgi:hypothetical protein
VLVSDAAARGHQCDNDKNQEPARHPTVSIERLFSV